MFTARRFRLIAFTALGALGFAQAAVAAMGCATLRADAARGNVAVMPDGSPCDMLPATPAPLSVKHFAQEAAASDGPAHVVAMPALPAFAIAAVPVSPQEALRFDAVPPAQGPPPLLLTLRLRH